MPLYTPAGAAVTDATIAITDVTTNNSATGQHGWLKKLDNNSAHYMDGTGAWSTPPGTGTGITKIATNFVIRQAGDLTLTNDSNWHDIPTISDLSIAAATGDVLFFNLDSLTDASVRVDVKLVTSGNYVGAGVGAGSQGIVGWANRAGAANRCGGTAYYTVVSGDISGGNVAARLVYTTASLGAAKFFAGTSSLGPLTFGVMNLLH